MDSDSVRFTSKYNLIYAQNMETFNFVFKDLFSVQSLSSKPHFPYAMLIFSIMGTTSSLPLPPHNLLTNLMAPII